MLGAVLAAVELVILLNAVAHDFALAVGAFGGEGVDGAFERVERVFFAVNGYREYFVVIVAANFASGHGYVPPE